MLTQGAIIRAFRNQYDVNPNVQIIDIKALQPTTTNPGTRYRLVISDGEHYQQAMVATQLNPLIESRQLCQWSVVQLTEFMSNDVSGRRIIIILNLVVVSNDCPNQIGNPQPIFDAPPVPQASQQHAMPQQHQAQVPQPSGPPPQPQYNSAHQQQHAQPFPDQQQQFQSRSFQQPRAAAFGGQPCTPIHGLNMWLSRWTIKARVTSKSDMRTWDKADKGGSKGKLFSVDLLDKEGGQIRATMFNDAADKFFAILQEGKVYTFTKGNLKPANKQFTRIRNEYEITFNADAEIEYAGNDDAEIEHQVFDFKSIEEIQQLPKDSYCDTIGIVYAVSQLNKINARATGRELLKREVQLVDHNMLGIDVTLWAEQAEKWNEQKLEAGTGVVLAIKNCRVSEFGGGKSLNSSFGSQLFVNPSIRECMALQSWWASHREGSFDNISKKAGGVGQGSGNFKTLADIKDQQLGCKKDPDYFVVRATVTFIKKEQMDKKPPWYKACPNPAGNPECKNKMVKGGEDGQGWHCVTCDRTNPTYIPRYILSLLVCDATGSQWLNAFNEVGEFLLKKTAKELEDVWNGGEERAQEYDAVFQAANFRTYNFRCRAKTEQREDQMRARVHVLVATALDFVAESKSLLAEIAKYDDS